jgi:hypothetical protein
MIKTSETLLVAEVPAPVQAPLSWRDFLESVPPNEEREIADLWMFSNNQQRIELESPEIRLYCTKCDGERWFANPDSHYLDGKRPNNFFARYTCKDCGIYSKLYAIRATVQVEAKGTAFKLGEMPGFGQPTQRKLLELLGSEKEMFLKGRRAENQGMGIAAFAYYRRVVENKKDEIIGEVIKVARRLGSAPEMIADLEGSLKETRFTAAVEKIRHGIPQSLLVDSHNPLTLLHDALSDGLHKLSDEECLSLAQTVRLVLAGLVERVSLALSEEKELKDAVGKLLNRKAHKASAPSAE